VVDSVLQIEALSHAALRREPYTHAIIDELFHRDRARALAATFPTDHYRIVSGGAEKLYRYDARPFVAFGRDEVMFAGNLSADWQALGKQLSSPEYREALGRLTNLDLADKIVTHVLYFNDAWDPADGGCLRILRSSNADDFVTEIPPLVGSSVVLVRSDHSWHGVPAVKRGVAHSRRTLTATFYRAGSTSTLFPEGEEYRLMTIGPNGSGTVDRLQDLVVRAVKRIKRRR